MFVDSSKVKVVESSVKGKKTGPVINSTGYVVPYWGKFQFLINSINESLASGEKRKHPFVYNDDAEKNLEIRYVESDNYYFLLKEMEVYFTKFGNEESTRCERKPVINVFPYPKKFKKSTKLPDKYFTEDTLSNMSYTIEEITYVMDRKSSLSETPSVVIMVPQYTSEPLDLCEDRNKNDYIAWSNSVINNGLLLLYVHTSSESKFFDQSAFFGYIKDFILDKGKPPKLNELEKLTLNKEELVCNLRKLLISMINNYDVECRKSLEHRHYPQYLLEAGFKDQLRTAISQVWKFGFSSNRGVVPIKKMAGGKIANTIITVQQDLLSRSTK